MGEEEEIEDFGSDIDPIQNHECTAEEDLDEIVPQTQDDRLPNFSQDRHGPYEEQEDGHYNDYTLDSTHRQGHRDLTEYDHSPILSKAYPGTMTGHSLMSFVCFLLILTTCL